MWWSAVCVKSDFIPMAWKDRGGRQASTLLAVVLLLFSTFGHCTALTQTTSSNSSIVLNPKLKGYINNGKEEQSRPTGDVRYGRLILGRNVHPKNKSFDTNDHSVHKTKSSNGSLDYIDYQSDMDWGWVESEHLQGQVYGKASPSSAAVERLRQMEPRVECVGDSMNLEVHDKGSKPGSLFFVNRGNLQSPLPLSNLPQSCGHSMRTSPRVWTFRAQYEGCYVTRENDYYIMPLLWLGLPLKMSCPAEKQSNDNPPMVSCYPEGMVITISGTSAEELQIRFKGDWQSLMRVSSRCGYSVVKHPDGVVISACYKPCVEHRDGMFTLELAGKDGEIQLFCPSLPVTGNEPSEPHALPCLLESSNKPCLTTPTPGKVYQKPKPPSNVPNPAVLIINPNKTPHPIRPNLAFDEQQAPVHPFITKPAEKQNPFTQSPRNPPHYFSFHPQPAKPVTRPPEDRVPATKAPQVPWYPDPAYPQPANLVTHPQDERFPATNAPQVSWYPATNAPQVPWYPATKAPQVSWYPATKAPQVPWYPDPAYPQPPNLVTHPPDEQFPGTNAPQVPWYPATKAPQVPWYPATKAPQVPWYPATKAPQVPWYPATKAPQVPWYPFQPQPTKPVTDPPEEIVPAITAPPVPWYPATKAPQVPWYPFQPQPTKPVTDPPEEILPAINAPQVPWYPATKAPQVPWYPATKAPQVPWYPATKAPRVPWYPFRPPSIKHVIHPPEDSVPVTKGPHVPWFPDPAYPQPADPVTHTPQDHFPATKAPQVPWYPFRPPPIKPISHPAEDGVPVTKGPHVPWYPDPAYPQQADPVTHPPEDRIPATLPVDPYPPHPVDCSTICPSGVSNCCPSTQNVQPIDPYPPRPVDCPAICPLGILNCCQMPISFHQHHHNHFGPVLSNDGGVIPIYPFKHLSDLLKYTSVTVPEPAQVTVNPLPITDQTMAPTKRSLKGFRDFWVRRGLRFPSAMDVNGKVPSSGLNKPTKHEPQIQPYWRHSLQYMQPYNPQDIMYPNTLPYNPQKPRHQVPITDTNKHLEPQPPVRDANKSSESQARSSDANKPLKHQPPNPFRLPHQTDPDVFYASKPLTQPGHQTRLSEFPMPVPPKLVEEFSDSHSSNSESIASFQQHIPSDQEMSTSYVSSFPIYYAGSKPSYLGKPSDKFPIKPSSHEPPESIKHYWNPIMPLPANRRIHASVLARPAGRQDPAAHRLNAYVKRPIDFYGSDQQKSSHS